MQKQPIRRLRQAHRKQAQGKKAVVTGGAGFIGTHLCEALRKEGYEVVSVDIKTGDDVRDTDKMTRLFAGAEAVFHTAALPRVPYSLEHPVETTDHNITGMVSALTAAARAKVKRFIYSSSGSAYGNQETLPLSETLPAKPVNPYGLQKYVGELFAALWSELYGLETVSLRYFNVYGPGLDPEGPYALAVGKFLMARQTGDPMTIFGDGTITRDFTHVRDVVRANILAASSSKVGKGEVINIGAGRNISIQALAEMFGGLIVYGPPRVEAHDSRADNRKAKELLGWEPAVKLEDGIAELKKLFNVS